MNFGEEYENWMAFLLSIEGGKYKRLYDNIELMWGNVECERYLADLLIRKTDKQKAGFDVNTFLVLTNLLDLHKSKWNFEKKLK